jgi:hypothetical protein
LLFFLTNFLGGGAGVGHARGGASVSNAAALLQPSISSNVTPAISADWMKRHLNEVGVLWKHLKAIDTGFSSCI